MNTKAIASRGLAVASLATGLILISSGSAQAQTPYFFPGPAVTPSPGPVLPGPAVVPGKEFSEGDPPGDRDKAGIADPEQNVAWDGSGGVEFGLDYGDLGGLYPTEGQVDALANHEDDLYDSVNADTSFLLFSTGNGTVALGSGPVFTTEGAIIGSAGDISYEAPGSTAKGFWATGSADIDDSTFPRDLDGLEVWGPELTSAVPPDEGEAQPGPGIGGLDADRFSLTLDSSTGVSVWNAGAGAYLSHADVVGAVTSLLGPLPFDLDANAIDLDAMMIRDVDGIDAFTDLGDSMIFSIRQLATIDPLDLDGFYATGSEIFKIDFDGIGPVGAGISPGFLAHGGHLWDHGYALGAMGNVIGGGQLDINALEAVSIPEPSRAALLLIGVVGMLRRRVK